jgi:hypothetical protein
MRKKAVLVVLGILFTVLGPILIAYGFQLRDIEIQAMKGEIAPFDIDFQKPFEVNFGSNIIIQTVNELSDGINLSTYINVGYEYPIQIKFRDVRLLVSAEIKNEEGETIAKIKDNYWVVNENNMIARDRNYNSYAFEVINSNLIPVLQVVVQEQNKIYIGGFFYDPSRKVLVTPRGLFINPSSAQIDENIQPIFRYPSEEHLGEMMMMGTSQIPRSTWVIFTGAVFTALGLICDYYYTRIRDKQRKTRSKKQRTQRRKKKTS